MNVIYGDLWDYEGDAWLCITTNGAINAKGECVMGRGCALEAKKRFPTLPKALARRIIRDGNHVAVFSSQGLITFPVKHRWNQRADLALIERSAIELASLVRYFDYQEGAEVILPKPGCGNGGLDWADVEPVLDRHLGELGERVAVIDFA